MKDKFVRIVLILGAHMLFVLLMFILSVPIYYAGLRNESFVMLLVFAAVLLMPFLDYAYSQIERITGTGSVSGNVFEILDSEDDDFGIDDIVEQEFETILELFSVRRGVLVLKNIEAGDYTRYIYSGRSKTVLRVKKTEEDELLKHFRSQKDMIFKKNLNRGSLSDRALYDILGKDEGDIAAPLFCGDIVIGAIVLGDRLINYTPNDIVLLKLLVSRFSIMLANKFFGRETVRRNELKREQVLAERVLRNFLDTTPFIHRDIMVKVGNVRSNVKTNTAFYGSFEFEDRVYCLLYAAKKINQQNMIFLPAVKEILRLYIERGGSLSQSFASMNNLLLRQGFLESGIDIIFCEFDANDRRMLYISEGMPDPFLLFEGKEPGNIAQLGSKSDVLVIGDSEILGIIKTYREDIVKQFETPGRKDVSAIKNYINGLVAAQQKEISMNAYQLVGYGVE